MITNQAPAKMALYNPVAGYKLAYIQHSIYTDYDVYDKSFWITEGENTIRQDYTDVTKFFTVLNNLKSGTTYSMIGAYLDSIIDAELRDAQVGFNLSDPISFTTKVAPEITAAYSTSQQVEVGVGSPIVNIETKGEADYVTIELKAIDSDEWTIYYRGPLIPIIQFGGVPPGDYRVRISGQITLPDGYTVDSSGTKEFPSNLNVSYNFIPPSAPTDIEFKVAHILDGMERYDLRVEWQWEKGNGANLREFVVTYVDAASYATTGWQRAQVMNVSSSQKATIPSFPFGIAHKFKISSTAWGPDEDDVTDSETVDFIITEDTPIDNSFINETGIDVNYAYIRGRLNDDGSWRQTFLIDAATGAINIGLLDEEGKAPISFDPTQRTVNIDGRVITKSIYSANFIMTNLDGTDNPAIYTQGKSYGDTNSGIWMGMDNVLATPKLDIGNATQWIRYDGTTLRISSDVVIGTPNGDLPIQEGIQGKQTVFIYKLATSLPAKPVNDTNYPPATWSTTPPNRQNMTQNIYAATGTLDPVTNRLLTGTSWSDVFQFSGTEGSIGEDGADGVRGPGLYTQAIASLTAFNTTQATAFFTSNFGGPPVRYDVITQYNSSSPATAFTRSWNGSSWVAPALTVHGDMIVNGTVTASKIVADNAFLAQLGVNTIYNRAAALASNPESVYTMKIDLANSYIHIR